MSTHILSCEVLFYIMLDFSCVSGAARGEGRGGDEGPRLQARLYTPHRETRLPGLLQNHTRGAQGTCYVNEDLKL